MYHFDPHGVTPKKTVTFMLITLAMALLSLVFIATRASAEVENNTVHTKAGQLWACHVPQLDAAVLSKDTYTRRGRQILAVRLDRNHDGSPDMLVIFTSMGTAFSPFPSEYVYDTDFDGRPDKAYRDEHGNGICSQMTEIDPRTVVDDSEKTQAPEGEDPSCHMDTEDPSNPKKEL
jgi:hypothetical protein